MLAVYPHVRSAYCGAALSWFFKVPRSTAYGWLAWFESLPEGLRPGILAFMDTQAPIEMSFHPPMRVVECLVIPAALLERPQVDATGNRMAV